MRTAPSGAVFVFGWTVLLAGVQSVSSPAKRGRRTTRSVVEGRPRAPDPAAAPSTAYRRSPSPSFARGRFLTARLDHAQAHDRQIAGRPRPGAAVPEFLPPRLPPLRNRQLLRLPNIPDDPDLAIAAGRALCEKLLEPLMARFGRISIRSAFRSVEVNALGNAHGLQLRPQRSQFRRPHLGPARRRRRDGRDRLRRRSRVHPLLRSDRATGRRWRGGSTTTCPTASSSSSPSFAAVNVGWREKPQRRIRSSSRRGAAF